MSLCGKLEETTEHLLTCEIVKQNVKIPEDIQINTNNKEEAIDMAKYISISIELINNIQIERDKTETETIHKFKKQN